MYSHSALAAPAVEGSIPAAVALFVAAPGTIGFSPNVEIKEAASEAKAETEPALASTGKTPRSPGRRSVRTWLCDTGCPFDLIGRNRIPADSFEHIRDSTTPVQLSTANGHLQVTQVVDMQINAFKENIEPYILDETPDVLSIGQRCVEMGYEFRWPALSENPYFINPQGDRIDLISINNCPYLQDDFNVIKGETLPALSAAALCFKSATTIACQTSAAVPGESSLITEAGTLASSSSSKSTKKKKVKKDGEDKEDGEKNEKYDSEFIDLISQAPVSKEHLFGRRTYNKNCRACVRGRMQRAHKRRGTLKMGLKPENFGDQCTGDHLVTRKDEDTYIPPQGVDDRGRSRGR